MSIYLIHPSNDSEFTVPNWVQDNRSFLNWMRSENAPEKGKIEFFGQALRIGKEMESAFHNFVKTEISNVLGPWSKSEGLGRYYADGMMMTRTDLDFSCEPDGLFVSVESWESGKVKLDRKDKGNILYGSPDMVLEVISNSSANHDQVRKKDFYHQAGITEYWLVDSRLDEPKLMIFHHSAKRYTQVKPVKGWVKSKVFGSSFRLIPVVGVDGLQDVKLERK